MREQFLSYKMGLKIKKLEKFLSESFIIVGLLIFIVINFIMNVLTEYSELQKDFLLNTSHK